MEKQNLTVLSDFFVESLHKNFGYFIKAEKKIHETQTKFQKLEIFETENFGLMLRLDNVFQTSEKDEFLYHEPLVHVAGITMNGPKTALVIGGGDGGAAEEFLKYRTLEKVVMVELDGGVVDTCRQYIPSISNGAFDSPKMELLIDDGINYIQQTKNKFDQIMLDLTDPFGPSIALYTKEFYQEVNAKLNPHGALSLHIESPISRPEIFARLYKTLKSVFKEVHVMLNYVPVYGTLWGYAVASQTLNPNKIDKETIQQRIKDLGINQLQYYNEDSHFGLLALPQYVKNLLAKDVPIIEKTTTLIDENLLKKNKYLCIEN